MKQVYGKPDYYITENGEVFSNVIMPNSTKRRGFKKLSIWITNGYLAVSLSKNGNRSGYYIHNLLLETFKSPRPYGKECRHLDGNRLNNLLNNLQWGTHQENQIDRLSHGTDNRAEHHPRSLYSNNLVLYVRKLCKFYMQKDVAQFLAIPKSTVRWLVRDRKIG